VRLNEHSLNAMLLRTASATGEVVVAGIIALVGVGLGAVTLFTFYSLVVTTQDVVTWSGLLVLIVAVILAIGAVRCTQYAGLVFDRAIRRLN
jgi:hypothetical protein